MVVEKNVRWLKDQVQNTGFGEFSEAEIRENIGKGDESFVITIKREFGEENERDMTESKLRFNRGKDEQGGFTDYYFFNEYDMRITTRPQDPAASLKETVKVDGKFPRNTITLKEMYNLKLGGFVEKEISYMAKAAQNEEKELRKFTTWKKADHSKVNAYGNHPLKNFSWKTMEKELRASEAIKNLGEDGLADRLVRSMKKGNIQRVVLKYGHTEITRWITVDAEKKSIKISETNERSYAVRLERAKAGLKTGEGVSPSEKNQQQHNDQALGKNEGGDGTISQKSAGQKTEGKTPKTTKANTQQGVSGKPGKKNGSRKVKV